MFIVFDLDGTLANGDHRLHHIQKEAKDWDAYFEACEGDEPISHAISVLVRHVAFGDRVEIWTGRSDQVLSGTMRWLHRVGVYDDGDGPAIRMRAAGDHRNDDALKAEWVERHGKPDLVYEDRDRVVAMWRAQGVPCFQVAPGAF